MQFEVIIGVLTNTQSIIKTSKKVDITLLIEIAVSSRAKNITALNPK